MGNCSLTNKPRSTHNTVVWGNFSAFLCLSLAQTNPDTNKPIIGVSTPPAQPGVRVRVHPKCDSCGCAVPFSSALRNTREQTHNGVARPWEKEHVQT